MSGDTTLDCMFDAKPGCACSHCEANRRIEALEGERDKLKWSMEKYEDRAEAAEARAERLRVALGVLVEQTAQSWAYAYETARKDLEDDKK